MADNIQVAYEYFVAKGLTPEQAAGIVGNLMQESGVNPESVQQGGPARGIAQWLDGGRWRPNLMTGNATVDLQAQLDYIWQELNTTYASALYALTQSTTAQQAALAFSQSYEMPGANDANNTGRADNAAAVLGASQSGDWTQVAQTGGGGTALAGGAGTQTPNIPGLNDLPALDTYIQKNYPSLAWLLTVPEVRSVVEKGVSEQNTSDQIVALLDQTEWWKTTTQAVKNFLQLQATNPGELDFNQPGSQAAQQYANIMATAASRGVTLDPQTAQTLSLNAMHYGWDASQVEAAIGSAVTYNGQTGNAGTVVQQLQAMAAQYYMTPTPQVLQSWAQNIAGGTQTMQQFQAQMQQDATMKWTGFAPQLAQGKTMQQLTDSYRAEAAKLMEVDPNSINFQTNPFYSKILDYVPPNSSNGVHRVMTLSEMDQYLRGSSQWAGTQQARDTGAQIEQAILGAFGKVAA